MQISDINVRLALRYLFVVGGVDLLDRTGLLKFCPKWLGKRNDLLSLSGEKTNKDIFWRDSHRSLSEKDVRKVVATVIETGIIVTMGTHIYSFNGKTYIQLKGGPIGLRLTAALANLVMCFFFITFRQILEREMVDINLAFRFVDDSRYGLRPFAPGWKWEGNQLVADSDEKLAASVRMWKGV